MKQEIQKLGKKWHNKHNLVFTRPNGSCLDYARVNEHFKAAVTLIGRPELTIHSIRHTYASVVWAMTHNLNAVKECIWMPSISQAVVSPSKYPCTARNQCVFEQPILRL